MSNQVSDFQRKMVALTSQVIAGLQMEEIPFADLEQARTSLQLMLSMVARKQDYHRDMTKLMEMMNRIV